MYLTSINIYFIQKLLNHLFRNSSNISFGYFDEHILLFKISIVFWHPNNINNFTTNLYKGINGVKLNDQFYNN